MLPSGGVYIAGKMRGESDCGFPKFFEAESWLLANTDFYPIFNPARRDVESTGTEFRGVTDVPDLDVEEAMEADLDFIRSDDCSVVVVLDDFAGSTGTLGEILEAWEYGKLVVYLRRTPWGFTFWPYATPGDESWFSSEVWGDQAIF